MKNGHLDDESKEIVDDRVEELVSHLAPWQMGYALELAVRSGRKDGRSKQKTTKCATIHTP